MASSTPVSIMEGYIDSLHTTRTSIITDEGIARRKYEDLVAEHKQVDKQILDAKKALQTLTGGGTEQR